MPKIGAVWARWMEREPYMASSNLCTLFGAHFSQQSKKMYRVRLKWVAKKYAKECSPVCTCPAEKPCACHAFFG